MQFIEKNKAEFYSGDGYSGIDYPMTDPDINFAVIKVNGRSPKMGYQVNTDCKELLYIINGMGTLYTECGTKKFNQGDVLLINKNEYYAFDGDFEAAVPCTPAWTSEQHKYIDEKGI